MRIVDFSLTRRVTVSMGAVALLLFGAVAFTRLPLNLMPELSYPSLTVETRLPGAAPTEVETLVTRPVEEVVGVVAGVQRLTSVSRPGLSQVTVELGWGREMDFAALDVRQKLDLLDLPREASKPVLLRFDPNNDPVMRLYLRGPVDLFQLRYLADELVKRELEPVDGVAAVKVHGGFEEEIEVRVDEDRLALLGLGVDEVGSRLLAENLSQAGGSLYEAEARYLVRSRNEFRSLDDIRATVLTTRGGRQVAVGDVARVARTHRPREVVTRFGRDEAVELAVYREGDANAVQVARAVADRLEKVRKELPEGVEVAVGVDQSRFIRASIDEVLGNALLGGLVAMVVLLLFLRDLRATVVIGLSIPISIVATFFLMYRTGTTLNTMSLGGLALGVGMLVDNAIVVLEAIVSRRESGADPFTAAREGAAEVGRAVTASTLTTVAVFLPVVFLEGIAAQLFRDMALTVCFSLLASLAVSLTLIPMLSCVGGGGPAAVAAEPPSGRLGRLRWRLLTRAPARAAAWARAALAALGRGLAWVLGPLGRAFDRGLVRLLTAYPGLLRSALDHRPAVLVAAVLLLAGSLALVPTLGVDLIPPFAQGELAVRVELPEGTPLEVTDRFLATAAEVLAADATVESFSTVAGGTALTLASTGTEGESTGRIQVRLRPGAGAAEEEATIARLRARLETSNRARVEVERATYFSFRTPVEVEVFGDRLEDLHAAAAAVAERLRVIPGLADVRSSAMLGNPEVQVRFDRDQLSSLGLEMAAVAETVRTKIQGQVATRFLEGDRQVDIRVRALEHGGARVEDVQDLIVGHAGGRPMFLKTVASVTVAEGPTEIRRIGQKRAAVVAGDLAGRDMGAVAADVRAALAGLALPATVTATLSGQEEELERSFRSLALAAVLAAFLVYLVMASQFESFLHPFVIILTLPLGLVGAVAGLAVSGQSVSVVAIIGAVILAGIVVNNAIVLVDAVNQRRGAGATTADALVDAGRARLRPILMTTGTTVVGLLPMALGLGEGAELRAPLAVTVIGGLVVATLLTLVVIPVAYSLVTRSTPVPAPDPAAEASP